MKTNNPAGEPRNFGPLTEPEERLLNDVREMDAVCRAREASLAAARNEYKTKTLLFWATVEKRLGEYTARLTLNAKGEIVERPITEPIPENDPPAYRRDGRFLNA